MIDIQKIASMFLKKRAEFQLGENFKSMGKGIKTEMTSEQEKIRSNLEREKRRHDWEKRKKKEEAEKNKPIDEGASLRDIEKKINGKEDIPIYRLPKYADTLLTLSNALKPGAMLFLEDSDQEGKEAAFNLSDKLKEVSAKIGSLEKDRFGKFLVDKDTVKEVYKLIKKLPPRLKPLEGKEEGAPFRNTISKAVFPHYEDVSNLNFNNLGNYCEQNVFKPLSDLIHNDIKPLIARENKARKSASEVVAHLRKLAQSLLDN